MEKFFRVEAFKVLLYSSKKWFKIFKNDPVSKYGKKDILGYHWGMKLDFHDLSSLFIDFR